MYKRARKLRQGVSVYKVYKLNGTVSLTQGVCDGIVKLYYFKATEWAAAGFGSPYVRVKVHGVFGEYAQNWFLGDMNVGPGCNEHRLFFSKKRAMNYMKLMEKMGFEIVK
jgi:hypothetical protein